MEKHGEKSGGAVGGIDPRALLLAQRLRLVAHVRKQLPAALGPTLSVDDVLQDTYFDAFRNLAAFTGRDADAAFRWLATVASNRIADLVTADRAVKRGGRGWKRVGAAAGDDSVVRMLEELAVYRRTPSRSAAGHEFVGALESAIEQLPADLRTAITLRYLDGESPAEIAARMGRTARAVHMLCNRGLKAVRLVLRSASLYV